MRKIVSTLIFALLFCAFIPSYVFANSASVPAIISDNKTLNVPVPIGYQNIYYNGILVEIYQPTSVNSNNNVHYTQQVVINGRNQWFYPQSKSTNGEYSLSISDDDSIIKILSTALNNSEHNYSDNNLLATNKKFKLKVIHVFRDLDGKDIAWEEKNKQIFVEVKEPSDTLDISLNHTGWTNQPVTVTINSTGSPEETKYRLTGAGSNPAWQEYNPSSKPVITNEGITRVEAKSTSNGHIIIADYKEAKLDVTIPKINEVVFSGTTVHNNKYYTDNRNVTLRISATDNLSGVQGIRFSGSINSTTSWQDYIPGTNYNIELTTGSGSKTVTVQVRDHAGNLSNTVTNNLVLDMDIPSITATSITEGTVTNNRKITLSITAYDITSGVDSIAVKTNSAGSAWSEWIKYPASSSLTTSYILPNTDGPYTVYFKVRDRVGRTREYISGNITKTIKLDRQKPVVTLDSGDYASNTWSDVSSVTVRVNTSDDSTGNTGITSRQYRTSLNGANWSAWSNVPLVSGDYEVTIANEGITGFQSRATDGAGNVSETANMTIKLDHTTPTVPEVLWEGGSHNTWSKNPVTVRPANSVCGPSGLSHYQCSVNVGDWENYDIYTQSTSGSVNIRFRAVNNIGKTSAATSPSQTIIRVDIIPPAKPTISINRTPNGQGWISNNATITVGNRTDPGGSGVTTQYMLSGAQSTNNMWQVYNDLNKPSVTTEGITTVYARNLDGAGNITESDAFTIKLDKTVPTVTFTPNGNETYAKAHSVTVNAKDDLNSLKSLQYQWTASTSKPSASSAEWADFNNSQALSIAGVTGDRYLHVRLKDNADNEEYYRTEKFRLDNHTPPAPGTATWEGGSNNTWSSANTKVTISGSESYGYSGFNRYQYSINSGVWIDGNSYEYEGTGTINIRFRMIDDAGNEGTPTTNHTIKVDKAGPGVTFGTDGNSSYAKTHSTTVTVTDSHSGIPPTLTHYYKWADTPAQPGWNGGTGWTTFTSGANITISSGSGDKYLNVRATDAVGNVTLATSKVFKLDNTSPTGTVSGNPANWTNRPVRITFTASDVLSGVQRVTYSLNGGSTWQAWVSGNTVSVERESNISDLRFRAEDCADNVYTTNNIIVNKIDTTSPGNPVINVNESWTNAQKVEGTVTPGTANGSPIEQTYYKRSGIDNDWIKGTNFEVSAEGITTIEAKTEDEAGNVSYAAAKQVKIDKKMPNCSVIINNGSPYTNKCNVTLILSAADIPADNAFVASGISKVRIWNSPSEDAAWPSSGYEEYDFSGSETRTWELTDSDGWKFVHVRFGDRAGNWSNVVKDKIKLDRVAPELTSFKINGGDLYTCTRNVNLTVVATDSGLGEVDKMQFKDGNAIEWSQWIDYTTNPIPWEIKTSRDGNKRIDIKLVDKAGNTREYKTDSESPSIGLDTRTPEMRFNSPGNTTDFHNRDWDNTNITVRLRPHDRDSNSYQSGYKQSRYVWLQSPVLPDNPGWNAFTTSADYNVTQKDNGEWYLHTETHDNADNIQLACQGPYKLDKTLPELSTVTVEGARYVDGSDYWFKGTDSALITVEAKDDISAIKRVFLRLVRGTNERRAYYQYTNEPLPFSQYNESDNHISIAKDKVIKRNDDGSSAYRFKATLLNESAKSSTQTHQIWTNVFDMAGTVSDNEGLTNGNQLGWNNTGLTIKTDNNPPTTPLINMSAEDDVWVNESSITFTLTPGTDSESGVAETQHKLGENDWVAYSKKVTALSVSNKQSGTVIIQARTIDNVGNVSSIATKTAKIDRKAPDVKYIPNGNSSYEQQHTTKVIVEDHDSGIKKLKYAWSSSEFSTPTSGWTDFNSGDMLTSPAGVSGDRYLYIQATDIAGNVSNVCSEAFMLDNGAPKFSVEYPYLNGFPMPNPTNKREISIQVKGTDTGKSGVAEGKVEIRNEGSLSSQIKNFSGNNTYAWELIEGDGEKTVEVRIYDKAGNASDWAKKTIFLDTVAPSKPIFSLTSPDGYQSGQWTNQNVKFTLTHGADPAPSSNIQKTEWRKKVGDDSSWEDDWTEYNRETELKNIANNNTNNIYVQARTVDVAGNISDIESIVARIDKTKPSHGSVLINNGDANTMYPDHRIATLFLTAIDDVEVTHMKIVHGDWEDYWAGWDTTEEIPFINEYTLDGDNVPGMLPEGDGEKTVSVRFRDRAGNWGDVYKDTILLDTTPPNITSFKIEGIEKDNEKYTAQRNVTLSINATDSGKSKSSGLDQMRFKNESGNWGEWVDYSPTVAWTLNNTQGQRTVSIQVKDKGGNIAEGNPDSIIFDNIKPTTTITMNQQPLNGWIQSNATVNIATNDSTAGVYLIRYRTKLNNGDWAGSDNDYSTWAQAQGPSHSFTVSDEGITEIEAVSYDRAGNISDVASFTVRLDKTDPTGEIKGNVISTGVNKWTDELWTGGASNLILSFSAEDTQFGSGIQKVKKPNNEWTNASRVTYAFTANGTYTFTAQDYSGRTTDFTVVVNRIDRTPPTKPVITLSTEMWTNDNVPVTITQGVATSSTPGVEGNGAPVKKTQYKLSGAAETDWADSTNSTSDITFIITNAGATTIEARTIDIAGNISHSIAKIARIDKTAPNKPAITPDDAKLTWFSHDVKVAIEPGSDIIPQGVNEVSGSWRNWYFTKYGPNMSGSHDTEYTGEITISDEGETTVSAVTEDNTGRLKVYPYSNVSLPCTTTVRIDKTAPVIEFNNVIDNKVYVDPVNPQIVIRDPQLPGINRVSNLKQVIIEKRFVNTSGEVNPGIYPSYRYEYNDINLSERTYNHIVIPSGEGYLGSYRLTVTAVDYAGNKTIKSIQFTKSSNRILGIVFYDFLGKPEDGKGGQVIPIAGFDPDSPNAEYQGEVAFNRSSSVYIDITDIEDPLSRIYINNTPVRYGRLFTAPLVVGNNVFEISVYPQLIDKSDDPIAVVGELNAEPRTYTVIIKREEITSNDVISPFYSVKADHNRTSKLTIQPGNLRPAWQKKYAIGDEFETLVATVLNNITNIKILPQLETVSYDPAGFVEQYDIDYRYKKGNNPLTGWNPDAVHRIINMEPSGQFMLESGKSHRFDIRIVPKTPKVVGNKVEWVRVIDKGIEYRIVINRQAPEGSDRDPLVEILTW
jgi:hypothetical protein